MFEAEHTVNILKIRDTRFCSELFQITVLLPRALLYNYTIRPIVVAHLLRLQFYFCNNLWMLSIGTNKAGGWIYCAVKRHHRNRPQTATRDPRWQCFLSRSGKLQSRTTEFLFATSLKEITISMMRPYYMFYKMTDVFLM